MQEHWHNLSTDESLAMQESSESGISVDEVVRRQKRYGMNKLAEAEKTSAFLRFISQYNDPLNYLLMGAALVALLINPDHPGDAIFIFIVLTANAFFGFWQENQAEQAMDSLKQMSISNCVVIRGDFESEVPTSELVPGGKYRCRPSHSSHTTSVTFPHLSLIGFLTHSVLHLNVPFPSKFQLRGTGSTDREFRSNLQKLAQIGGGCFWK